MLLPPFLFNLKFPMPRVGTDAVDFRFHLPDEEANFMQVMSGEDHFTVNHGR